MTADTGWLPPYYARERSGIPYQLDPDAPTLPGMVRSLRERTPQTPCDPDRVASDLLLLPALMRDMHFGIATGAVPRRDVDAANAHIAEAAHRVHHDRPETWDTAIGDLCDRLRVTLRDRHLSIAGAPPSRIRPDDPVLLDDGPAVAVRGIANVLTIRVRTLVGTPESTSLLEAWVADGAAHFGADRIIVDLRGNTGGDDSYTFDWLMAAHPEGSVGIASESWMVGDAALGLWNPSVVAELAGGASPRHLAARHRPDPSDSLRIERESDDDAHQENTSPWGGRMLVVTDARTGSSGESSAWYLRELLGARIVGGATAGSIEYGDICGYPLPGGMWVNLATKRNRFRVPVEIIGVQPDLALDVTTPLPAIAEAFDAIHQAAGASRR